MILQKFDSSGNLVWSTYVGGDQSESVWDLEHRITNNPDKIDEISEWKMDVTVDNEDNIILTGQSNSSYYPTTFGVEQKDKSGKQDAVISKFDSAGQLLWSTYLGGGDTDWGDNIGVDQFNNIYVSGTTYSDNFPVKGNVVQSSYSGKGDLFLTKLTSTGSKYGVHI
jgi:hypothetical protein